MSSEVPAFTNKYTTNVCVHTCVCARVKLHPQSKTVGEISPHWCVCCVVLVCVIVCACMCSGGERNRIKQITDGENIHEDRNECNLREEKETECDSDVLNDE